MRISVLGINFFPESIGIGLYTTEMCEYLRDVGHEVAVFTAFPYYPEWKIQQKYEGKLFLIENREGIIIKRSYVYVPRKVTTITRILHELSFIVSSFLNLLFSKRPEIIIVVSPPLLLGILAYVIGKLKRAPFVFHIQDLQPDAAVGLGMIKRSKFVGLLYKIERFIYKKACLVSVISDGMRERVISKGVPEGKVVVFPNWVDTDFIKPLQRQNGFRQRYGLGDKFIVLYAGSIGVKQGLEILLNVADSLRDLQDILFLIVGDGICKGALVKRAAELHLPNVKFLPVQPREFLPEMLSAADISLAIQQTTVTDFVMPSKLLGLFASGRPIIVSAHKESELSKVVKQANCAIIVKPEEPDQFKDAIFELYSDSDKREILGKNGREYICNLSKDRTLHRFEQELIRVAE
jgi:colanic acid biosynthesis glycosyl transferase WcaI